MITTDPEAQPRRVVVFKRVVVREGERRKVERSLVCDVDFIESTRRKGPGVLEAALRLITQSPLS